MKNTAIRNQKEFFELTKISLIGRVIYKHNAYIVNRKLKKKRKLLLFVNKLNKKSR